MKQYYFLVLVFCYASFLTAQNVSIPDANFKAYLVGNRTINTNGDNEIQVSEAKAHNGLIWCMNKNISNLTGIEAFTSLTELNCSNNQLTSLDVSKNVALKNLYCDNNKLTSLNVSGATELNRLKCPINKLGSLDISKNTKLTWLDCNTNQLANLDVSKNTLLEGLSFWRNELTDIDVSKNIAVYFLRCSDNQLTSLDVSKNKALDRLWCNKNYIKSIDVSNASKLTWLNCTDNKLTSLNLKNGNNSNMIMWADINPNLTCIQVDDKNTTKPSCNKNGNAGWCIDSTASYSEDCNTASQNVSISDANFKKYLLSNTSININGDSEIQITEAERFTETIDCSFRSIRSLKGIEAFINLTGLTCWGNQLRSIDISKNIKLTNLQCFRNLITNLDVSKNKLLTKLVCSDNYLSSLNVANNTALTELFCYNNQLRSIDVSNNKELINLYCYKNRLKTLNVSSNKKLKALSCYENQLTALEVKGATSLVSLYCMENQLTSLDVSNNKLIQNLNCGDNKLVNLNVKNGNNGRIRTMFANNNSNLTCIEVDNKQATYPTCYTGTNYRGWCKDTTASYSETCTATANIDDVFTQRILIAPNPVNSKLSIKLSETDKIKSISVFNILGEELIKSKEVIIDFTNLPSGIYLLKIENTNSKVALKKVLKE
ncbi:T9SS type A sorting domain-containing protein [Tenacibaculum halocynthiae]|uniref:T9SS type A sorting domain-containing protein n=1 Tax=Tenacibaculum halocynthiae TaxID=1254437 RepID=UPI003893A832